VTSTPAESVGTILPHALKAGKTGGPPSAAEAIRVGAHDGRAGPSSPTESVIPVPPVVECLELLAGLGTLNGPLGPADPLRALIGPGRKIEQVLERVRQVADSCFTILIEGETGTGKELVARAIHLMSPRNKRHFIALDCGAIPETLIESELFGYEKGAFTGADRRKEGHFQLAERGTLFLDEIVNLPSTTQAKFLRTLQERQVQPVGSRQPVPVDVRIIAACNVPLEKEMWAGRFRQDLYYRLNEFSITMPPLRERLEDILYLANRFLVEASMELQRPIRGITEEAAQLLLRYPWPGNVRELRNVIRQAVLLSSDVIGLEHLSIPCGERASAPADGDRSPAVHSLRALARMATGAADREALGPVPQNGEPFIGSLESPEAIRNNGDHHGRYSLRAWKKKTLERLEKEFLVKTLTEHSGNVTHTAKALGIYRSTLQRLMKRHHLPAL
jgi:two-component system nitrogen regulation response regulator GlnG